MAMASEKIPLFCVDGTNVVRGCYGYGGAAFRAQEEADNRRLVEVLETLAGGLAERAEIELFFDGPPGSWAGARSARGFSVRFTREASADEIILDRVRARAHAGAGRVTVVTADGELGRLVCEEGGRWQKVRPGAALEAVAGGIERRFSR